MEIGSSVLKGCAVFADTSRVFKLEGLLNGRDVS